jgi:nucleotide-binding universal stress UspA family protein
MTSESDARPLVVVGVDGSEGSLAALRWAARYGAATKTPVKAVLVWHYPTAAAVPPVGHLPEPVEKEVEGEEKDTLREALAKAAPDTADAQIHGAIRYGHPAEALIDESGQADLLVVGRNGHGGFLGMRLGSVSQHCVNAAQCPVVVVRSHEDG